MKQEDSMTGFYYIGSQRDHVDKLIGILKCGYASDNMQQAITELTREKHFLPVVICCEPHFGLAAITRLAGFLANHPILSGVPFIIDADGMTSADYREYVKNKTADDIIFLNECDEKAFIRKIRFMQKIKSGIIQMDSLQTAEAPQNPESVYNLLRRCFDILVASFLLILLAPLFLLIAVAVIIE
jgi:hypothetical protein